MWVWHDKYCGMVGWVGEARNCCGKVGWLGVALIYMWYGGVGVGVARNCCGMVGWVGAARLHLRCRTVGKMGLLCRE